MNHDATESEMLYMKDTRATMKKNKYI